jgi:hypothetical protein
VRSLLEARTRTSRISSAKVGIREGCVRYCSANFELSVGGTTAKSGYGSIPRTLSDLNAIDLSYKSGILGAKKRFVRMR